MVPRVLQGRLSSLDAASFVSRECRLGEAICNSAGRVDEIRRERPQAWT
jgi:hypothetical protein